MGIKISLSIILLFAFYLRIIGISYPSGLCYDELFSWNIANAGSAVEIIKALVTTDYHPPFYFLTLHYWIKMFGDSDFAMRMLSVLFSMPCVIVAYFIGKTYKNRFIGLIYAGYFSFIFLFICKAQVVRFYQAGLLFALLCVLFSIKLIKRFNKKNLFLAALSNLALLYTQTTAVIFVFVEILMLIVILFLYKRRCLKTFFKTCFSAFLFYIPQLIIFAMQIYNSHMTFWKNPWEWTITSDTENCFILNLNSMIIDAGLGFSTKWVQFVIIALCVLYAAYKSIKKTDKCLLFMCLFSTCFSILYLFLHKAGIITLNCNCDYYLIADSLFLIMFLMTFTTKRNIFLIIILCIHIYFGISLTLDINHITKQGTHRFRVPIDYITENYKPNVLVYSPYGDKLIKKYNKKLRTLEIDGDRLFTMKDWQKETPKVFDVDFSNFSTYDKKEYFKNYLIDSTPSKALLKTYNDGINSLNSGDYFIVLFAKSRYIEQAAIDFLASNEIYYNFNSKSTLMVAKITNDILKLAENDSRLKLDDNIDSSGDWFIIAFKKM